MVHLHGWPHDVGGGASIARVVDDALADAAALVEAGFQSIMVQNLGSRSTWRLETPHELAVMTMLVTRIRAAHPHLKLGLNLPSDDPQASLAIAYATGCQFVRLKVWIGTMRRLEGTLDGCAYAALQYQHALRAEAIEIWADVLDRTGQPAWPTDFARAVDEAAFAGATTIVVSATTHRELIERLHTAKDVDQALRRVVGGGVTADNLHEFRDLADGIIAGAALYDSTSGGRSAVSPAAARRFHDTASAIWRQDMGGSAL